MTTNVLTSEGDGKPLPGEGECSGRPAGDPSPACCSCGAPGHSCGAMPQPVDGRDVTVDCMCCFVMPLLVVVAAVAMLYDTLGEALAFLVGAAAWIALLLGSKFVSRTIRAHRSGE